MSKKKTRASFFDGKRPKVIGETAFELHRGIDPREDRPPRLLNISNDQEHSKEFKIAFATERAKVRQ
jgi:hypothetical protein